MNLNFTKRASFKYEVSAIILLVCIWWVYFFKWWNTSIFLFIASILAIYTAMNIWANDVANNMWPAVWSKAITLVWALIIAAIFEAGWAIIAWADVVETIKWWIIDTASLKDINQFLAIMMATLVWWALWMNIATYFKAPVSTTHSIIWWLIWAWISAAWFNIVDWSQVWTIAASWIISPLMWWIVAVLLFLSIRNTILRQDERWDAAQVWVPIYIAIMSWAFSTYLLMKWLKQLLDNTKLEMLLNINIAIFIWYVIAIITFVWLRLYYSKKSAFFKNSKKFINSLFNIPLVFAVALLSFAHWANDVANAVWPLAAIAEIIKGWIVNTWNVWIPFWIMLIWAIWLVVGLSLFWAKLIKTVWWEITKLNQTRAFCVALSAAITVIIASQLWLPISSTHVAIGWVFWIWLLRERTKRLKWSTKEYIKKEMIKSILLAWIITLPMSALLSSIWYFIIFHFIK